MNLTIKNVINLVYHLICILATIAMTIYCIYQYQLNKDVSIVEFKEFNTDEDFIYPSITLCFKTKFIEDKLNDDEKGIDLTSYSNFLLGEYWNDNMMDIDFDNVTTRIEDYLLGARIWSFYTLDLGWVEYIYLNKKVLNSEPISSGWSTEKSFNPKFYASFRDVLGKCFSFDIPNNLPDKIHIFELFFNNSIFPNATRPRNYGFGVKIHYPNQLLTSNFMKYSWRKHDFGE